MAKRGKRRGNEEARAGKLFLPKCVPATQTHLRLINFSLLLPLLMAFSFSYFLAQQAAFHGQMRQLLAPSPADRQCLRYVPRALFTHVARKFSNAINCIRDGRFHLEFRPQNNEIPLQLTQNREIPLQFNPALPPGIPPPLTSGLDFICNQQSVANLNSRITLTDLIPDPSPLYL